MHYFELENSLIYKVARAGTEKGLTQQAITDCYGISRIMVSRLLGKAQIEKIIMINKKLNMEKLANKTTEFNKLVLILLFIMLYSTVHSQTYYFSNSGDDSYTEEQAQNSSTPWKTLDKLNSLSLSSGDTILFKKGDTWRGQINVDDSGVTYGAYGTGEKPVIKGSIPVTGWTQYSGNIYKATVSEKVRQLFCNDKRQTLARYPNTGYARFDKVNSSTSFESDDVGSTDWTGAMAHMRLKHWTFGSKRITSCNNGAITIQSAPHYDPKVGWGFFINNHLKALDAPGEWYYNSSDSTLYFWPPNDDSPDNYTIEASVIKYGFKIYGAHDITIDGFMLKHQIESAIEAQDPKSDNITIKNNEIYGVDQNSIRLGSNMFGANGMQHATIDNNIIQYSNRNGIFCSVDYPIITNNVIKHIGDDYTKLNAYGVGNWEHASIGIDVHGAKGHLRENRIDSIGYIGIQFGNGHNYIIEYNYVSNYCMSADDGGGIYCFQMDYNVEDVKGAIVRYNIVKDGIGSPEATNEPDYIAVEGIYLDGASQEVTVQNNTVSHGGSRGIFTNHGKDHKFYNNVVYNSILSGARFREVHGKIEGYEIKGNVFYSLKADQIIIQNYSSLDSRTDFGTYDNNYYCNPYSTSLVWDQGTTYTLEGWQAHSGQDANTQESLIGADDIPYGYGPQLISNTTFDSNISGWDFWSKGGSGGNSWENNDKLDGGTLKHNPGSSSSSYASHNISIEKGKLYEIKFSIVSNVSKSLNVNVIRNHGDYATLGFGTTITVNTNRQDFTFQFTATETEPEAMIYFYNAYGKSTPMFWLDNVSIKEIVSMPSPEEVSPLFMNPTMETVTIKLDSSFYRDLDGNVVTGSISLEPFTSKILTISHDSDSVPPAAPSGLSVTAVSSSSIDLSWDNNTEEDFDSYTVRRATTTGGPYTTIATRATSSNYSDTGLAPETTYYYIVIAKDKSSNSSENSNEVSATTTTDRDTIPPAAPSGLSVAKVSGRAINLNWDDNTEEDFDSYTVKRATTSGGPYTTIATGVTSSNYSDKGLAPETTYYYIVIAKDKSDNSSENSNEISATTTALEPLPAPYSFYDFEEDSGISVADSGTLQNNATLIGSEIDWATGGVKNSESEKDGCVRITGSTKTGRSYVKVPFNNLHNSNDYTFSAWVKWDTNVSPDWAYVFWQNGDDSNKTRHVDMWWDKQYKTVSTSMNDENGGSIRIRPTGTTVDVFDGNWHLVAITMENGTDAKLWVDGEKTGEVTSTTKVAINGGDDLWLGTMPDKDPDGVTKMVGFIDRVGIYDQALTSDQMAELYVTKSNFDPSTGVKELDNASMFKLYQNTPNPFSSETTIAYELKQSGSVTLQLFDITGKVVTTLEQSKKAAGLYQVKWNGLNASKDKAPNGIYLCKLRVVSKNKVFYDVKKIVVK